MHSLHLVQRLKCLIVSNVRVEIIETIEKA